MALGSPPLCSLSLAAVLATVTSCGVDDPDRPDEAAADVASLPVLTGPVGQWTWYDLPGAVCGFGQPTGIGVSVGTSSEVLIYLEGGGLCWDEISCEADLPALPPVTTTSLVLASYFTTGFTGDTFHQVLAAGGYSTGIFDRTLPNNPYKDATQIYVPYCSGDVHTGSTKQFFPTRQTVAHWQGGDIYALALDATVASFPSATRVTLSGSSAGGYGSLLDFARTKEAFGDTRVDLVTDSGPVFTVTTPFLALGYPKWNTNAVIPDDCPECLDNYHELYAYYARKYPTSRFAFLSHDQDLVIAAGHLMLPYPTFYFTMKDFTQHTIGPNQNWRYFVSAGTAHTTLYNLLETSIRKEHPCVAWLFGRCVIFDPFHEVETGRTELADWLTQMATDSSAWANTTSIDQ